jgi:hypothetical protein
LSGCHIARFVLAWNHLGSQTWANSYVIVSI